MSGVYKAYKERSGPRVEEKDYITKSALRRALHNEVFEADSKEQRWAYGCWIRYRLIDKILNELPSADVRHVKRGEWVGYPDCLKYPNAYSADHIVCSICEECFSVLDNDVGRFDFCPHCGADMREES